MKTSQASFGVGPINGIITAAVLYVALSKLIPQRIHAMEP